MHLFYTLLNVILLFFFNRPIQLLTIVFFLFLAISCLMQETPDRPTHILHVQQKRVMTPNTAELVVCHF